MFIKYSTQVPNILFDYLLKNLTEKELKVLLVVIRQTIGWYVSKGVRKNRDWISQRFFIQKTGLSGKSVSEAIDILTQKGLIIATDEKGSILNHPHERRGRDKVFYGCGKLLLNSSSNNKNLL